MEFTQTFSREYLQGLQQQHKIDAVKKIVGDYKTTISMYARAGKTYYFVDSSKFPRNQSGVKTFPAEYIPTIEELVEGFKTKYPDCKVEYTEMWEETNPGVKVQKKGILIDWS